MSPNDKPVVWLAGEVKSPPFSTEARIEAGFLLRRLQGGDKLGLPHSRPMGTIGRGCHELRIVDQDASWRIVYFVDGDAVVILEVFKKQTQTTPQHVIATSRARLKAYKQARKG